MSFRGNVQLSIMTVIRLSMCILDKIPFQNWHNPLVRVNRENGWIKPAFLLGKSVCSNDNQLLHFWPQQVFLGTPPGHIQWKQNIDLCARWSKWHKGQCSLIWPNASYCSKIQLNSLVVHINILLPTKKILSDSIAKGTIEVYKLFLMHFEVARYTRARNQTRPISYHAKECYKNFIENRNFI